MGQKYTGTFDIPGGFSNKGSSPISDNMVVEKFNDLLNNEELPFIYQGIIVYSEQEDAHYTWNGEDRADAANWKSIGGIFVNTNNVTQTVGGFIAGEPATPPQGLSPQQFGDKLLFPANQPAISFNISNQLIEKGTSFSETVNISFSQNDAGALDSYSLEKNGTEISVNQSTLVQENPVLQNFSLRARVDYEASGQLSAGTISTNTATISPKIPQWKGSKNNNTTFNNLTRDQIVFQLGAPDILSNDDNRIIDVPAGEYGVFLSVNSNAKIISDETGLPLAEGGGYTKSSINFDLKDGTSATLTQYFINTAQGNFKYYIE